MFQTVVGLLLNPTAIASVLVLFGLLLIAAGLLGRVATKWVQISLAGFSRGGTLFFGVVLAAIGLYFLFRPAVVPFEYGLCRGDDEKCFGVPVACILEGDKTSERPLGDYVWGQVLTSKNAIQGLPSTNGTIEFRSEQWRNEECGTSGHGWAVSAGSCSEGPRTHSDPVAAAGQGMKQCVWIITRR
jgi:hypothetical protein